MGAAIGLAVAATENATTVGDIQVCYFCSNTFGIGFLDGPAFIIGNSTTTPITGAVLSINAHGEVSGSLDRA